MAFQGITVVMPAYNAQRTIAGAISSVNRQQHLPKELIIVDDGSCDSTQEVALQANLSKQVRVRMIRHQSNLGLVAALQTGVDAANTQWIARLDADDEWYPTHLRDLAKIVGDYDLRSGRPLTLVANRAAIHDAATNRVRLSSGPMGQLGVMLSLCWDNPFVHSASMFSLEAYHAVGGYRKTKWEDFDLWIRLAGYGNTEISGEVGVKYIQSASSLSRIGRALALRERSVLQVEAIRLWPVYLRPPLRMLSLINKVRALHDRQG
jgi:glycosyltransferase involved in cell wall biosynthesis